MHIDNNNNGDMNNMEKYLMDVYDSGDIQKLYFLVCLTAPEPSNRIKAPAALRLIPDKKKCVYLTLMLYCSIHFWHKDSLLRALVVLKNQQILIWRSWHYLYPIYHRQLFFFKYKLETNAMYKVLMHISDKLSRVNMANLEVPKEEGTK
jgi:hypothetical protein